MTGDDGLDMYTRHVQKWHFFGRMWEGAEPVMVKTPGDEALANHLLSVIEAAQGKTIGRVFFSINEDPYMMCWVEEKLPKSRMN